MNFCDTDFIGRYDVKGQGDKDGVDSSFASYFEVTPNGVTQTQANAMGSLRFFNSNDCFNDLLWNSRD